MDHNISTIINYNFKNVNLLNEALTRQSAISEGIPGAGKKTYQRLEFLGDSVMRLAISDLIFTIFPDKNECDMTNLRIAFEKNEFIGKLAKTLGIGKFLKIGKGEEMQNIRENPRLLADFFEAIIGAVFVDSNDFNLTKKVTLDILKDFILTEKKIQENQSNLDYYYQTMNKNVLSKDLMICDTKKINVMSSGPSFQVNESYVFESELTNALKSKPDIAFKTFISKVRDNLYLDCDIFNIQNSNNELLNPSHIKNYLFNMCQLIKEYFYSFNLKPHYILCKTLFYMITFYQEQESFIYFITLICFAHNGISEYYRQNYEKSKEYFESAFGIIREQKISHPEIKVLISYYYCELVQDKLKDDCLLNIENDKSIMELVLSEENFLTLHLNFLIYKMKCERDMRNVMKNNNTIHETNNFYDLMLENVKKSSQKSVVSLNLYFNIFFKKLDLNKKILNRQESFYSEIKKYEEEVSKNYGNSLILASFYRFYIENMIESENIVEIYKKLIKLLLEHYTFSSRIITEELIRFSNFIYLFSS